MKKLTLILLLVAISGATLQAQTKKMYVYIQTHHSVVFENGTFNWKAKVPYKNFVRFVSEIIDVPKDDDGSNIRLQFYEYLMKNYLSDFKKMKLHEDYPRASVWEYKSDNKSMVRDYEYLFEKQEKVSWNYETILVKGFKYDAAKKSPSPLYAKAEKLLVKGIE